MTQSDDQCRSDNPMRPMLQAMGVRFVDVTVDPSMPVSEYQLRASVAKAQQQALINKALNRENVRRLSTWFAVAAVVAVIFVCNNYSTWFGDLPAGGVR